MRVQRKHMMVASGRAQVNCPALPSRHFQSPCLRIERLGARDIGNAKIHAPNGNDREIPH